MTCYFFHNGIYMPKRLFFPSDLSATPQTPCLSAFRLKDMHCEMFQPENILQKNQFPKNWKNTGPAEGFRKRLRDSILSPIFHSYIFAMYKNESLWI